MSYQILQDAKKELEASRVEPCVKLIKEFYQSLESSDGRMDEIYGNILLQKARYTKLQSHQHNGTLYHENYTVTCNQIMESVLASILEMESIFFHPKNNISSQDPVKIKIEMEGISLYFEGSLEATSREELNNLLRTIREKIEEKKGGDSNMRLNNIENGSIKLTYDLPADELLILEEIIKAGELDLLGFLRIERKIPQKEINKDAKDMTYSHESNFNYGIDWDFIIDTIRESKCIIFLGADFPQLTNYKSFREASIDYLKVDENPDISAYYKNDELFLFKDKQAKIRTIYKLKKFYREHQINSKNYQYIAQLPIKLFINAGPDDFLPSVMKQMEYSYHFEYFNKHFAGTHIPEPKVHFPLIYNLVGSFDNDDSLLLTHDDLFSYLAATFSGQKLPHNLMSEVYQTRSFIFLGVDFDKWYVQLMMRLLKIHDENHTYVRYATKEKFNKDTTSICIDQFQIEFVNQNISEFVEELFHRCKTENLLRDRVDYKFSSDSIRELVGQDNVNQVFEIFRDQLGDESRMSEFLLLVNRMQRLKKQISARTISHEESEIERMKITTSLMSYIDLVFLEGK